MLIGCAQAFAIMPGISRSGSTVVTALALGVAPLAAAEFSFLMSIIAITGAAARVAPDLVAVSAQSAGPFVYGGLAALGSGVAALWLFNRMMRRRRMYPHFPTAPLQYPAEAVEVEVAKSLPAGLD